ncbi:Uncharacterized protein BM_BM14243 [Brugia malayi]|uniref:Bm14243 n=1 Tax=Brugia malayi TaxID=6279 RepID=A0A0J9XZH2_BRUMA|nr:Bm14243 [Brugia malayi]VIO98854.1 Uncharacterized protein BM_BM14243 [Brugia malayi]
MYRYSLFSMISHRPVGKESAIGNLLTFT